ncbi:SNF2-related protein [Isoalcanivorax pacificus]|uniref:SNF2-related protein n=1 Tax=Isoalcanivorax pacificus TaxID=1306787 RepID=UPI000553C095|nr:SNF2-related protein [Isoalcanivorax pacificus]
MTETLQPGETVRISSNPRRVGTLSNQLDGPPHRRKALVRFQDGSESWILLAALERVGNVDEGPYDTLKAGRFGRVTDLRAAITFYRLSGKLANLLYSLNTTNTEFFAYQFKPVLNFLESPCNGILIADEVGLGKTIEAGLIWTELQARLDARRLLVICPAMLCEKWRLELGDRFGIKAEIVDAGELVDRLKIAKSSPYQSFALISSMQGLRPPKDAKESKRGSARLSRLLEELEAEDPLLDMVVIDEAHYLRNKETQTNKLARSIRPAAHNLVLLSATPIQMRSEDLFNLLHLLDEDAFPYPSSFDEILENNKPLIRLRDRVRSGPMTRDEFVKALEVDDLVRIILGESEQVRYMRDNPPTDEELESPGGRSLIADQLDRINPLTKVVSRTLKRDVHERRVIRNPKCIKAKMTEPERIFYQQVTEKVRQYCESQQISTGFILMIPQRQIASSMAAACRGWQERLDATRADAADILYEIGLNPENVSEGFSPGNLLLELIAIAKSVGDYSVLRQNDSKYASLSRSLKTYWEEHPGKKIVLFSFYKQTLIYLQERLEEEGISSIVLHGGTDKQDALNQFKDDNGPSVLLSSEVASEGVDLQFSSLLVNYDLPWNPMRIEQRIGRIDRIGQREEKILIFNFMYEETVDERVYESLLARLDVFTSALGVIEGTLGDKIQELTLELLTHKLSPEEEEERIRQTRDAIENLNIQQVQLEEQASHLIAHGEYIQNKVKAAKELGRYIRGEDLLSYVRDFLCEHLDGCRLVPANRPFEYHLELSYEARALIGAFIQENQLMGKSQIISPNPPTLYFNNRSGDVNSRAEQITQSHPLIRFITDFHRRNETIKRRFPVVAARISHLNLQNIPAGVYAFCIQRWMASGARDTERLEYVAWSVGHEHPLPKDSAELLINTVAHEGEDWLGTRNEINCNLAAEFYDRCSESLEDTYRAFVSAQEREDRDRRAMMISSIEKHLRTQGDRINERIARYEREGDEKYRRMIPAERGKLKHLTDRLQSRIAELRLKDNVTHGHAFVSAGVIKVE